MKAGKKTLHGAEVRVLVTISEKNERNHGDRCLAETSRSLRGRPAGIKGWLVGNQAHGDGTWPNVVVVAGAGESHGKTWKKPESTLL